MYANTFNHMGIKIKHTVDGGYRTIFNSVPP
jgi:hypothetical protein